MAHDKGLLQTFQNSSEIEVGMVVLAPLRNNYQRARVVRQPNKELNVTTFQVSIETIDLIIYNMQLYKQCIFIISAILIYLISRT